MMQVQVILFLLILFLCENSAARARPEGRTRPRPSTRQCSYPKLINGKIIPLQRGKMMRLECDKGYSLYGQRYAECFGGRWSLDTYPTCIKGGCAQLPRVDNGTIAYMNQNASALLFCEPNFEVVGSNFAHCNGSVWDRPIGSCKETNNAPSMSCDFESESICGWTHDADHDFDFKRNHGHDNKSVSIATGPSVDHTIGIPYQGHYMVINTNMEVYSKAARLISPLYKIDAEKICFEFYYHMYGVSVGTLRVYAKPESVNMQDALVSDEVTEANNDYVIFEIKGAQGNVWKQFRSGTIKKFNESFQIIIEAISGQTRLSDIAFDDVSILTDQDCANSADNDDDDDGKEPEDADGIFDVESCVNRCFENATVLLIVNKTLTCSCSIDCSLNQACCPDFMDVCMKDDSSNNSTNTPETTVSTTTSTLSLTTTTKRISTTTTSSTTISSTKISSTTALPRTLPPSTPSSTAVKTMASTPKVISTTMKTETPQVPQNAEHTTKSDFEEIPKNSDEIEDEHEILPEDSVQQSEKLTNEKTQKENFSFILTTLIITVSSVFLAFVAVIIVYKQYRKSTDPLNYKEKSESGSGARADEEFSEIRYLTSDETLDFTLLTPDNTATDL